MSSKLGFFLFRRSSEEGDDLFFFHEEDILGTTTLRLVKDRLMEEVIHFNLSGQQISHDFDKILYDLDKMAEQISEKLIKMDDVITAHKEVNDFKQKYSKVTNLSSLSSVQALFIKDRELWINFLEEQEKIKQELSNLNNKFIKLLKSNDFADANKIIEKVTPQLQDLLDEDIKKKWESIRQEYLKKKVLHELAAIKKLL